MATEVKLKPGWLTRDVGRASKRAKEWESMRKQGMIAAGLAVLPERPNEITLAMVRVGVRALVAYDDPIRRGTPNRHKVCAIYLSMEQERLLPGRPNQRPKPRKAAR